jgi:PEP-CTERM motif-containing protein
MRVVRILSVLASLCAVAPVAHADPFRISAADVAADFSSTDNPNGVWRYGWSETLGSPLVLSTSPRTRDGVDTWPGDLAPDGNPAEYHNGTQDLILLGGGARFEPGQFGLHPGPDGQYAVVRYTAPDSGSTLITAEFSGQDTTGTSSDVHVLFNGLSLLDAFVEGNGNASIVPFDRTLSLKEGDTIDFAVGFGSNGTFFGDSTALAASIQLNPVPEPGTLTLLTLGVVGLARRLRGAARPCKLM